MGAVAFWAGLYMAAHHYPSVYDWRYMTVSSLLYPQRDPAGYLWAWSGIVLCGLAGLWWARELRASSRLLQAGYLLMMVCAVCPARLLNWPKAHEMVALAAFIGVSGGLLQLSWRMGLPALHRRGQAVRARAAIGCLPGVAPLLLAAASQAYVTYALPGLPWVGQVWRSRGIPVCLSFAFWEWLTCATLSAYMLVLSRRVRAPE